MTEQVYAQAPPISIELTGAVNDTGALISLNMERKGTNIEWLSSLVTLGTLPEDVFMNLVDMMNILERIYPENWDIAVEKVNQHISSKHTNSFGFEYEQESVVSLYNFGIIVKFPELTITNSKAESRDIKDLYVKIKYNYYLKLRRDKFEVTYNFDPHLRGMRGKVSNVEYNNGYLHSHLPSRGSNYNLHFDNFCLGGGEITNIISMLRSGYTSPVFQLFCFQLEAYAKWESLEGGPHYKIATIGGTNNRTAEPPKLDVNNLKYFANKVTNNYRRRLDDPAVDLDWKIENDKLAIVDNHKLETLLTYSTRIDDYLENHILYKDQQGFYYNHNVYRRISSLMPVTVPTNKRIFRGQEFGIEVYPETTEQTNINPTFIINPYIRAYVKSKFETYANYKQIRKATISRANQLIHSTAANR